MHDETDGGLRLSGEVSGTEEIRVEVLKWGSAVEVLEPPTLREAVYREACAIAALYAEKPDTTSSTRDDKK